MKHKSILIVAAVIVALACIVGLICEPNHPKTTGRAVVVCLCLWGFICEFMEYWLARTRK